MSLPWPPPFSLWWALGLQGRQAAVPLPQGRWDLPAQQGREGVHERAESVWEVRESFPCKITLGKRRWDAVCWLCLLLVLCGWFFSSFSSAGALGNVFSWALWQPQDNWPLWGWGSSFTLKSWCFQGFQLQGRIWDPAQGSAEVQSAVWVLLGWAGPAAVFPSIPGQAAFTSTGRTYVLSKSVGYRILGLLWAWIPALHLAYLQNL